MFPFLSPTSPLPSGSIPLNSGHTLLGAKDKTPFKLPHNLSQLIYNYFAANGVMLPGIQGLRIVRWARLKLPNGQIARSLWKEKEKCFDQLRKARNVKFICETTEKFGEVQFFFHHQTKGFAVVSIFSDPNNELLESSFQALHVCKYQGNQALQVIQVDAIHSVVAMIPFDPSPESDSISQIGQRHFMVEKFGLDMDGLRGVQDEGEE
ncbi:hypothetical protein BJ322DRAFT_1106936 [Thelephora terrestris]|uniref:Uncharacterized protein n=1 Tax=Thelephora terrestris TaxID=56493 RepID=A0A9P6HJS5_9AGAM|nr:hypothetical protein BJ322DRAFT_1106936 [Thelephora terrestris]